MTFKPLSKEDTTTIKRRGIVLNVILVVSAIVVSVIWIVFVQLIKVLI